MWRLGSQSPAQHIASEHGHGTGILLIFAFSSPASLCKREREREREREEKKKYLLVSMDCSGPVALVVTGLAAGDGVAVAGLPADAFGCSKEAAFPRAGNFEASVSCLVALLAWLAASSPGLTMEKWGRGAVGLQLLRVCQAG